MLERDIEMMMIASAEEARKRNHEYVCVEHLLSALLLKGEALEVIRNCGGNSKRLQKRLEEFFHTKLVALKQDDLLEPYHTLGFQRVIQRALLHARYSHKEEIKSGDFLAAIFTETESHAVYFLKEEGISRLNILEYISHGSHETVDFSDREDPFPNEIDEEGNSKQKTSDPLSQFCMDLNRKVEEGRCDPLIGRDIELERTIQILLRRQKNNPLYVGDQGVGKTALVEGLASKIVHGEVPAKLKNLRIYSLDLGATLAGTKYRGDFEQRFKAIISALEKDPHAVLFIDEIHTIIGAGSTSGSALDAASLLKPVLTSGKNRCIGSTTYEEYKAHFEKDRALARRFSKIEVKEPSLEETIEILKGLKPKLEEHHQVSYAHTALKAAVDLSSKFIRDRFLPDKAIDILDEAGAVVSLAYQKERPGQQLAARDSENNMSTLTSASKDSAYLTEPEKVLPAGRSLMIHGDSEEARPQVKVSHIEQIVSKVAQIPPRTVSTSDREKLRELEEKLRQVVFGQDEAISSLVRAVKRARAGLRSESKPVGSFLFAGPTGVGKTEVAKQLALVLGLEFLRFDMSEYMEKHSVSRLIGAPPGYVGFDQGGLLTDSVIRHPYSVLLFDEIEKAHPDLFNVLLQVMDHATLTDHNGRKADFRNVTIIMTSNAGSESIYGKPIGFSNEPATMGQGAIEKTFRPEFRNRLDLIVKFRPLPTEVVEQVVDKFITEIEAQLISKKVSIVLKPEARHFLATSGYNPQFGARSVYRLIQSEVKDSLADELLFGKLVNGGTVMVDLEKGNSSGNEKIVLHYEARKSKVLSKATESIKEEVLT